MTADPSAFRAADLVLLAAPAQATRAVATALAPAIPPGIPVVACAKGIEQGTGLLQTDIIAECLPQALPAALSGPGFAEEIARGLPTAVTSRRPTSRLRTRSAPRSPPTASGPMPATISIGVELGGAVKNVLAIACGIIAGRGLGESARAALIARGLAEMMRLGAALGARAGDVHGPRRRRRPRADRDQRTSRNTRLRHGARPRRARWRSCSPARRAAGGGRALGGGRGGHSPARASSVDRRRSSPAVDARPSIAESARPSSRRRCRKNLVNRVRSRRTKDAANRPVGAFAPRSWRLQAATCLQERKET